MTHAGFFVIAFYPDGCPYVRGPYDTHEKRRHVAGLIKGKGHQVVEVDANHGALSGHSLYVGNPANIDLVKEDSDG